MNSENPYESPQTEQFSSSPDQTSDTLAWKLFSFQGRIPRRTYWGFSLLITFIFYAAIIGLAVAFGDESSVTLFGLFALYIPLVWISLALQIKRWHDRDKSGWWVLVGFIPLIGGIIVLIQVGCLRGTEGPNQYGADPT